MALSTVYDVNVRYHVDDKASKGVGAIGTSAAMAAKNTGMLAGGIQRLMAMGAGLFGFRAAKSALIDYNSSLDQARIQMSGLLQMNMGGSFAENQGKANKLLTEFIDIAKRSTATSKDFVDMASLITGPISRAGGSMQDLREVTKGAVIAAKAFGIAGDVAARDIGQALMGNLGAKDQFARALLEPIGITTKKWNEMFRKEPEKAAQRLVQAFQNPALANMAAAQGKSWAGVMSTLQDNIQRAFGAIGLPLMQRITSEMAKLNSWFEQNPKKVAAIIKDLGDGLVKAFEMAKRIAGFLVEHKSTIMAVAKAYLVSKATSAITGGILAPIGALQNLIRPLRDTTGAMQGFGGMVTRLSSVTSILIGSFMAAKAAVAFFEDRQEAAIEKKSTVGSSMARRRMLAFTAREGWEPQVYRQATMQAERYGMANAQEFLARDIVKRVEQAGYLKDSKLTATQVQLERLFDMTDKSWANMAGDIPRALEIENRRQAEMLRPHFNAMVDALRDHPKEFAERLYSSAMSFLFQPQKVEKADRNTDVKIQKIEVASDDPDRWAMNLVGALQDVARNPTQARRQISENA